MSAGSLDFSLRPWQKQRRAAIREHVETEGADWQFVSEILTELERYEDRVRELMGEING